MTALRYNVQVIHYPCSRSYHFCKMIIQIEHWSRSSKSRRLQSPVTQTQSLTLRPQSLSESTQCLDLAAGRSVERQLQLIHLFSGRFLINLTKMTPVLAYWNIRGLAQPVRLLLEYTGTEFEDKMFECGQAPGYDKSCWLDIKHDMGLDFPNLPYYIDGDVKITQSNAIMRHIARKHSLCGKSEAEEVRVDILENQAMDFRNGWVRLCYGDFENQKQKYIESLDGTIKLFSKFMGDNPWFAGENISFVDFVMYELIDQHLLLVPDMLQNAKNLADFQKRFEELESIKKYMGTPKFMKAPINNKMSKFGAK